jgi:APA family basic amino acid/polyamine antiporter
MQAVCLRNSYSENYTIHAFFRAREGERTMSLNRLLAKKSVARIQQEAMQNPLKRSLGKWNLLSLGIGCIIGAGIFVMTGTASAQYAGPAIMISFVIAGLACAFAGLCYAELASVLPISGSAYTYTYATLGEVFAWVMGWLLVLEYGLAASTVAVGWSGYVVSFVQGFGLHIPVEWTTATGIEMMQIPDGSWHMVSDTLLGELAKDSVDVALLPTTTGIINLPAFLGIAAVSGLLVLGVSESVTVNNIIVAIKVAVIIAFIALGVFYVNTDNWVPFIPENTGVSGQYGWSGVFRAASVIFFAYVGFEAVSTAAQEAKNPQKDMPFGILGALVVCTVLYMLVSAVLTGVVHFSKLNVADPMAVAVDAIGLGWFSFIIKVGAIMGLTSVMLVLLYGQTRIFYIISRDGLLPKLFSTVHKKFHTPWINTIFVGVLVAIAAAMTPIGVLGDLVSLGTLAAFMMVCFSVLYLRIKQPELERPFRTPGMPWVPVCGMLSSGGLIVAMFLSESGQHMLHFLPWYLGAGALIYVFYGYRHSKLSQGEPPLEGDTEFVKEEHEIRVD